MSQVPTHIDFRENTQHVPPQMPVAVQKATTRFLGSRATVVGVVGPERWEELRRAGHEVRQHAITHLDSHLTLLEERVTQAGGHVHWARDAAEARQIVLGIARQHRVQRVVKVKSMVSEEIGLNHALEADGIRVLETDLGEYIIQLAGVGPSHITAPAVHLTKEGIADLFRDKLGVDAPPDPMKLTEIARVKLREEFLAADMGISGGNFLVAETGTLVTVTNEGNGRMCTTLPPVHVAVVGIEKVVPDLEGLSVMLNLLARSATGQKLSCYTSLITGTRRATHFEGVGSEGEALAAEGGPREFHLVLLDNGRSDVLRDEAARDTLLCIRCGACLNICPIYNHVGGHAYGWVYSGPIGAILSPQLLGTAIAGDLPFASSLCGACDEICPVKIPISDILLHLRHRVVEGDQVAAPVAAPAVRAGAQAGALAFATPWLYQAGSQVLKAVERPFQSEAWLLVLPPPVDRWTSVRPFPAFRADFRQWWKSRQPAAYRQPPAGIRKLGLAVLAVGAVTAIGLRLSRRSRK